MDDEEKRPLFEPSQEWLDEFESQVDERLIARVRRYAKVRAALVRKCGRRDAGSDYAEDLYQQALADTREGIVRWDPAKKSLQDHVIDVIRYRTRNDAEHAAAYPEVSLHVETKETTGEYDADGDEVAGADHVDGVIGTLSASTPESQLAAAEILRELRVLAAADRDVLTVIDAYASGAEKRDDVLAMMEMSPETYNKARIRLSRLAGQLEETLRRQANEGDDR